jgi:hypothetical protein
VQQEQQPLRPQLRKQSEQVACLFEFPRTIFRKFFGRSSSRLSSMPLAVSSQVTINI